MILVKNTLTKISFLWKQFRSNEVFHPLAKISTYDQHVHHEFISTFRPQNLENAEGCQVAGKPKKLPSELPDEVMATIAETIGRQSKAVTRIVQEGQVYFSKTYQRMKRRNASVILFENGKIGEVQFYAWNEETGATAAVFQELVPDPNRPFFFDDAGRHIMRVQPNR